MPHVTSLAIEVDRPQKTVACWIPFFDAIHVVPQGYELGMRQKTRDSDERRFALNANGAADIIYLAPSLVISYLQDTQSLLDLG